MEPSSAARPGRSVMAGDGLFNEHSQPQHVAGADTWRLVLLRVVKRRSSMTTGGLSR